MASEKSGLESAAKLCRAREAEWRALATKGGSEMHSEDCALNRAWEAMTCAECIEELAKSLGGDD